MINLLNRIIRLNVELEGALRVAAERRSPEALESAKHKFAEISALFAMLNPEALAKPVENMEDTVKIEEAENAEESPMDEPELGDTDEEMDLLSHIEEEPEAAPATVLTTEVPEAESETASAARPKDDLSDIRKLFTLNDKFLFKRELFNNNDAEFNDTLALFASMKSLDEATEYVFEDLRWDADAPNVKEFMKIISAYFASRG